jgi:hypothetical protein
VPTFATIVRAKAMMNTATISVVSASGFVAIAGYAYYFLTKTNSLVQISPSAFSQV